LVTGERSALGAGLHSFSRPSPARTTFTSTSAVESSA
jgi:hypothetical protein